MTRSSNWLLAIAAIAIGFAAIDTYVVVLDLPEMMTSVNLDVAELQKAAPVISGFLLGYIAVLPIIGRLSDIHGRVPILIFSLFIFSAGSFVTAAATDLPTMVVGRFAQGIGGGGLIPPTLALVADIWPPQKRGLPLGVIGAVQELGSVIGPLFGAVVLSFANWQMIFWINMLVGLALVIALKPFSKRKRPLDPWALGLGLLFVTSIGLHLLSPESLVTDITLGLAWITLAGSWLTPILLLSILTGVGWIWRKYRSDSQIWTKTTDSVDLIGALGSSIALGAVVVLFASAEPQAQLISTYWPYLTPIGILGALLFLWRQRHASNPLVPAGALNQRGAWGALIVSFFIGVALISALVDVPIFARLTVAPDSQLDAALVLLRMLVALPVGAILGGYLTRRVRPELLTAFGLVLAAVSFWRMSSWGIDSLNHWSADIALIAAGFGIGLTIAPVNSRLLDSTQPAEHGLASALLVVARMVGMLVGISVLTAIGLRRFYLAESQIPDLADICQSAAICPEYTRAVLDAALTQLRTVFAGAAIFAIAGAAAAIAFLRQSSPANLEA